MKGFIFDACSSKKRGFCFDVQNIKLHKISNTSISFQILHVD